MTDDELTPSGTLGDEEQRPSYEGGEDRPEAQFIGPTAAEGLTTRTVKGVAWSGLFQLLAQPLVTLSGVVLARLLRPSDFGLMGMAGIVLGLMQLLNEFGLSTAVIQKPDLTEDEMSSLFWLNLAIGVALTLAGVALAWPVAAYFGTPQLRPLLAVLSIGFTVSSVTSLHGALLTRDMQFRAIGAYNFAGQIANFALSIGLALAGAGVWSLVLGGLLSALVPSYLLLRRVKWWPRFTLDLRACASLVKFGANVTGGSVLNYATSNLDYLIIGKTLGASLLGVYSLAFNLMTFPVRKISTVIVTAAFPAFSRIQNEHERFSAAFLRATRLLAMATIPLLAILGVLAPEVILGLYGPKWSAAIFPLQILTLAGMQKAVGTLVGVIFKGKGRPELEVRWNAVNLALLAIGLLVGVKFGITGVSIAVSAVAVSVGIAIQYNAAQVAGHTMRALVAAVMPGIVLGLAAGGAAWGTRIAFSSLPDLVIVLIGGVLGVAVALLLARVAWPAYLSDATGMVRDALRSRRERRAEAAQG